MSSFPKLVRRFKMCTVVLVCFITFSDLSLYPGLSDSPPNRGNGNSGHNCCNVYDKFLNLTLQGSCVAVEKVKEHFLPLTECKYLTCVDWFTPSGFVPSSSSHIFLIPEQMQRCYLKHWNQCLKGFICATAHTLYKQWEFCTGCMCF